MTLLNQIRTHPLGLYIDTPTHYLFWGNRRSQIDRLKQTMSHFQFYRPRQTHSDIFENLNRQNQNIFKAENEYSEIPEADSLWTTESQMALLTSTADCNPILVFDPISGCCASIHAGWRGVASNIFGKTMNSLFKKHPSAQWTAFVGPHIEFPSFEIERNICAQIVQSISSQNQIAKHINDASTPDKCYLDLFAVLKYQWIESGGSQDQIFNLEIDTVRCLNYHSYRRDKENSGRQFSFVVKK